MGPIIKATEDIDVSILFNNAGFIMIGVRQTQTLWTQSSHSHTHTHTLIPSVLSSLTHKQTNKQTIVGIAFRRHSTGEAAQELRSERHMCCEDHSPLPQPNDRKEATWCHFIHFLSCRCDNFCFFCFCFCFVMLICFSFMKERRVVNWSSNLESSSSC